MAFCCLGTVFPATGKRGASLVLPQVHAVDEFMHYSLAPRVSGFVLLLLICFRAAASWRASGSFVHGLAGSTYLANSTDFYERVGYKFERFDSVGYENVVARAEQLYRADPEHWQSKLVALVEGAADWASRLQKPLVTTECWGIVDYKDWPGLDWGWVKELCEVGVRTAVQTGQWKAISTSNFCGPQFVGMWRDIAWHQRLTKMIRQGV